MSVLCAFGLAACDPQQRYEVLSFLFEGVPRPGEEVVARPYVRGPRRIYPTVLPTPTPAEVLADADAEKRVELRTWEDVRRNVPRTASGGADWVEAFERKIIDPKAGLEPDAEPEDVFPLDLELVSEVRPSFKVPFSHETHTQLLVCDSCHAEIFQMAAGASGINMAAIYEGDQCGVCHGPVAFGIQDGCERCHLEHLPRASSGDVDWAKALAEEVIAPQAGLDPATEPEMVMPLDLELVPESRPDFSAAFSHEAHTQVLACPNCHPSIFQMETGASGTNMTAIFGGEYCGVCHGPVAFGIVKGCARCHPAALPDEPQGTIAWGPAGNTFRKLPRDVIGGVDWGRAFADKLIDPKPGLEEEAEPQDVFALNLERVPKDRPDLKVVFSHEAHTQWLACESCHPELFEMAAGSATMSMADLYAGKYCGACHGTVAFDVATGCTKCHPGLGGGAAPTPTARAAVAPKGKSAQKPSRRDPEEELGRLPQDDSGNVDWVQALGDGAIEPRPGLDPDADLETVLPLDLELKSSGMEGFDATFGHAAHTEWLACTNCHPAIFEMAVGTAKMTMDDLNAGKYCGVCHGPVAFEVNSGCGRCHLGFGG